MDYAEALKHITMTDGTQMAADLDGGLSGEGLARGIKTEGTRFVTALGNIATDDEMFVKTLGKYRSDALKAMVSHQADL